MLAFSPAKCTAVSSIQKDQCRYKKQYDRYAKLLQAHIGDWVLVRFQQMNLGKTTNVPTLGMGSFV